MNNPDSRLAHFKLVHIITPEKAAQLGIPAEAPIAISPFQNRKDLCSRCQKNYTPLVYQAGFEVIANHNCKQSGGIYHYSASHLPQSYHDGYMTMNGLSPYDFSGWDLVLEPTVILNSRLVQRESTFLTSQSTPVQISEVRAFCRDKVHSDYPQIKSGFVMLNPHDTSGRIYPACTLGESHNIFGFRKPILRFQTHSDGSIGFRPL